MLNGLEIPLFRTGRQHGLKLKQTGNPEAAILWIRNTVRENYTVWRQTVCSHYITWDINAMSLLADRRGKRRRERKQFIAPAFLDKT